MRVEINWKIWRSLALIAVLALAVAPRAAHAVGCETAPATVIGDPSFFADVQTFIDLGVDPNVTCLENALWTDPANFGLGTYVGGADGQGHQVNPLVLGSYVGDPVSERADNANHLDLEWVQDTGNQMTFSPGIVGGRPSQGIIWNLGGQANQAAVFVQVDHGPVPGEVLENTAWLSNDPNAADGDWTQAFLTHVYGFGWMPDNVGIADGFVAVYTLPDPNATFQYVSVTWGGPGAILRDGDNEIDAVGGLTAGGVGVAPEFSSRYGLPNFGLFASLLGGMLGIAVLRRARL
jgi:hypothetical protein